MEAPAFRTGRPEHFPTQRGSSVEMLAGPLAAVWWDLVIQECPVLG